MLANRKRSRDVLHDFNNSVDVEDNELELVSPYIQHKCIHLISFLIFPLSLHTRSSQQQRDLQLGGSLPGLED